MLPRASGPEVRGKLLVNTKWFQMMQALSSGLQVVPSCLRVVPSSLHLCYDVSTRCGD